MLSRQVANTTDGKPGKFYRGIPGGSITVHCGKHLLVLGYGNLHKLLDWKHLRLNEQCCKRKVKVHCTSSLEETLPGSRSLQGMKQVVLILWKAVMTAGQSCRKVKAYTASNLGTMQLETLSGVKKC